MPNTYTRNIEATLKGIAALCVFFLFYYTPVMIYNYTARFAKNTTIIQRLETIQAWGDLYKMKNNNYQGFNNEIDVKRAISNIEDSYGLVTLLISDDGKNYCVKTVLADGKTPWCVDSNGYSGKESFNCQKDKIMLCK